MDGVHVVLWKLNQRVKNYHKGKEKQPPTHGFNIACLANGKIFHCSEAFAGIHPDASLATSDPFVLKVKAGAYFGEGEGEFQFRTSQSGEVKTFTKPWVLVDGEFPLGDTLLLPPPLPSCSIDSLLQRWMESMRKVNERLFGSLTHRFRILQFGLTITDPERCQNIMRACCVLNNMILIYNQKARSTDESELVLAEIPEAILQQMDRAPLNEIDVPDERTPRPEHKELDEMRFALAKHFLYRRLEGTVKWPTISDRDQYEYDDLGESDISNCQLGE
jgi:hypothetical protein